MLTLGSVLFLVLAILLGIIVLLFCDSYRRSPNNSSVRNLFFTFLSIFSYAAILTIVSILFSRQLTILAWAYNLSIFLGLTGIFYSLELPIFEANPLIKKYLPAATWLVGLTSIAILLIQMVDFRLPIVNANGVIFWNLNPMAAWLSSALVLIFTLVWAYLNYDSARLLENFRLRWKLYILSLNMVALGLSAFIFFPSHSEIQSLVSFLLVAPAYLATIIVLLYFRVVPEKSVS